MIIESYYWKEEINRSAQYLGRRLAAKKWTPRSFAKLEKCIMIGAYGVRKLAEAQKIPPKFLDRMVPLTKYDALPDVSHNFKFKYIEDMYDLEHKRRVNEKLSFVLNQIIHSHVYVPIVEVGGNAYGIAFNSDRSRDTALYFVGIRTLKRIFEWIANGEIVAMRHTRIDGELKLVKAVWKKNDSLFKRKE